MKTAETTSKPTHVAFLALAVASLLSSGCQQLAVTAATGTNIGLELGQNPATQSPQAKLGYTRSELAFVRTNTYDNDVANVLMELKYDGIISTNGGIYQRLAVGKTAVKQGGAALMFARDAKGNVSAEAANAAATATEAESKVFTKDTTRKQSELTAKFNEGPSARQTKMLTTAANVTKKDWASWADFVRYADPDDVKRVHAALKAELDLKN